MAGSTVKLTFQVDDGGTVRVIDDANSKLRESTETVSRLDRAFSALKVSAAATVAAVGAAGAAAGAVVKQQIDQIDEIGLLARNLGLSARELSSLTLSAELANVQLSDLGRAVGFLQTKIVDARQGGRSGDLFKSLGIDVGTSRDTMAILFDVADALSELGASAERTTAARELLSRQGVRLIEVFAGGSAALREQIELTDRLGLAFDDVDAVLADQLNDNIDILQKAVTGTAREFAITFLPVLAEATTQLTDFAVENREAFAESAIESVKNMAGAFGVLSYTIDAIKLPIEAVTDFIDSLPSLTNLMRIQIPDEVIADIDARLAGRKSALDPMSAHGSDGDPLAGLQAAIRRAQQGSRLGDRIGDARKLFGDLQTGAAAAKVEVDALAASIQSDLAFALGRIEQGTVLDEYFQELPAVAEEASVQVADSFVEELERAEVAVIDLGALLGGSLTSAVDNLIASGKFNLADVFVATGRTVVSRMVSGVLQETLQFPTIPADITSLFRSSAGQARVARAGTVTGGDFGAGMSFDASSGGFMTDAATGAAVFVPGGGGSTAAGGGFNFAGTAGAALGYGALAGGVASAAGGSDSETMGVAAGAAAGAAIGSVLPGVGTAIGAAVGAAVGLIAGLIAGDDKPNKDQETRMALDEASKKGGIFPTLALAKEPPDWFKYVGFPGGPAALNTETRRRIASQGEGPANRWFDSLLSSGQIRPAGQPAFMGGFSSEIEALGTLLGLEGSQVDEKVGRNLGIRADILGIGSEQFLREIRATAQSVGTLDEALKELNFSFLRHTIDGKDASFTQEQYNARLRGTINLLLEDLPPGVDAIALAFANLDQYVGATVVNIEDMIEAIEQAAAVASGLQSGLRGAGTSAVTGILTGSATSSADFRRSVLNSAVGAIGENTLNAIVQTGPFAALMKSLTSGILGNDPAAVSAALANVPGAFDQIQAAVERFIPLFDELAESIDGGAAAAARQGRSGVVATIDRLMFSTMTPAQQQAELRRRIADSRSTVAGIIGDDLITSGERSAFDRNIGSITADAEALFNLAGQYASGSPMNRALRGEALDALRFAESAWEVAISTATVGDMNVNNVNVAQLIVDTRSAAGLLTKAAETPEGRRAIQQAAGLGG